MAHPSDESYDGPRWRYGLTLRPLSQLFGIHDGDTKVVWIIKSDRPSDDPRFRQFGTFDCTTELSAEVVAQQSLIPLGQVTPEGVGADLVTDRQRSYEENGR